MPMSKLEIIQAIVRDKQAMKIKTGRKLGYLDLFTASAILKVHDALSPASQEKYLGMEIPIMANIAFKLLK